MLVITQRSNPAYNYKYQVIQFMRTTIMIE